MTAEAIGLIFQRLCEAYRRDPHATMSRQELGAGMAEDAFKAALRELRGLGNDQDLRIRFDGGDPDRIALGPSWRGYCEDIGQ